MNDSSFIGCMYVPERSLLGILEVQCSLGRI